MNFAAAAGWSERPPGHGVDIDLQMQWDEAVTTFTRPEPVVYEANIGDATVELHRGTGFIASSDELHVRLSTVLSVKEDIKLGEVRDKWVVPLYDLLSFFWLKNPGVVWVRVQLAEGAGSAQVHYGGRLASADESYKPPMSERLAQLATQGYSFEHLIRGYWQWREGGYGRALELLIESQDPQLDESLQARLLNAFKSVEWYVRTQTGTSDRVKIAKVLEQILDDAGQIGAHIRDMWQARGQQPFGNSIARIRNNYIAHEQSGIIAETTRSQDEPLDQYWHLVALQWLLRRTYLQAMGIDAEDATDLVASSLGYTKDRRAIREHYQKSKNPIP
ncbi:MAG: hypothetical protein J4G00_07630 [Actinomycetia bacterium]|nr:hypothetical protein [Actinomycetes bacterium]